MIGKFLESLYQADKFLGLPQTRREGNCWVCSVLSRSISALRARMIPCCRQNWAKDGRKRMRIYLPLSYCLFLIQSNQYRKLLSSSFSILGHKINKCLPLKLPVRGVVNIICLAHHMAQPQARGELSFSFFPLLLSLACFNTGAFSSEAALFTTTTACLTCSKLICIWLFPKQASTNQTWRKKTLQGSLTFSVLVLAHPQSFECEVLNKKFWTWRNMDQLH